MPYRTEAPQAEVERLREKIESCTPAWTETPEEREVTQRVSDCGFVMGFWVWVAIVIFYPLTSWWWILLMPPTMFIVRTIGICSVLYWRWSRAKGRV